jgi:hypothetical protein
MQPALTVDIIMVCVAFPYSSKIFKRNKLFNILFFGFTPVFTRPPILAVLLLRKALWITTINTLFVFHAPFSTHLFSTRCHYIIQILIIISKSMYTVEFMDYLAQCNFQPGRAVEQRNIL